MLTSINPALFDVNSSCDVISCHFFLHRNFGQLHKEVCEWFSEFLKKKGSKTKKRMKEEEIEKGDCGPPTRSLFFDILSDLNQAVPNDLADESQMRQPDTPPVQWWFKSDKISKKFSGSLLAHCLNSNLSLSTSTGFLAPTLRPGSCFDQFRPASWSKRRS